MIIKVLENGDQILRKNKRIEILFSGKRKVLSTSFINGGINDNLKRVYNFDAKPEDGSHCQMLGDTMMSHMEVVTKKLGYEVSTTAGLTTAASMENASIKSMRFLDTEVTAVVTAGIDVNGGRAGDPASYYEKNGVYQTLPLGTINIMLHIQAKMPDAALAVAMITATEAKAVAISELQIASVYSSGIASGSGTDGMIVVTDECSDLLLTDAGKHSKLGELIGLTVKEAVKEALFLQTQVCPEAQFSLISRLKRYGITANTLYETLKATSAYYSESFEGFNTRFAKWQETPNTVISASFYAYLLDQVNWGLISETQAIWYLCDSSLWVENKALSMIQHIERRLAECFLSDVNLT